MGEPDVLDLTERLKAVPPSSKIIPPSSDKADENSSKLRDIAKVVLSQLATEEVTKNSSLPDENPIPEKKYTHTSAI